MKLIAKTMAGLEPVLAEELKQLGAAAIEPLNRAVYFEGDLRVLYRANLELRTALRILKPIHSFKVRDEQGLYRKIFDIEAYTRQQFKAETIPGLEPQQRMPDASRPRSNFGGRDSRGGFNAPSRDRKFGGPARGRDGGGFAPHNDFARRSDNAPRGGDFAARGDHAPRGDFAPRKPGFAKPAGGAQRPSSFGPSGNGGGAGFGPRDNARRPARPARPTRG